MPASTLAGTTRTPHLTNSLITALLGACAATLLVVAPAPAAPFTVYPLPASLKEPDRIATGPDGALWFTQFVDAQRNLLGRITTDGDASVVRLARDVEVAAIGSGPDGALWYAGSDPSGGRLGSIAGAAGDELALPGTTDANGLATGPDGALWFTNDERIGRLVPGQQPRFFNIRGAHLLERIVAGPDGALWFTDGLAATLGSITPTGARRSFRLPLRTWADDLAAGPDGALWFTSFSEKLIGRMSPSGKLRTYRLTRRDDAPDAIAAGPDGAVWFTRTFGIGRITPGGEITEVVVPEADDEINLQEGITAGPDGAIWFAQESENIDTSRIRGEIGRLDLTRADEWLLTATLNDAPRRAGAGRRLNLLFHSSRKASGFVQLSRGDDVVTRRLIRAQPGANGVTLRVPRTPGRYRLLVRVGNGEQFASDSAIVTVTR